MARWEEIKKTFKRNQLVRGTENDAVGRVVGQLSGFQAGLESIQETLEKQLSKSQPPALDLAPLGHSLESLRATIEQRLKAPDRETVQSKPGDGEIAAQVGEGLKAFREDLTRAISALQTTSSSSTQVASLSHELEMIHSTLATLKDLAAQQRDHLRNAQELLATRAKQGTVENRSDAGNADERTCFPGAIP